ncbi:MAG: hypothetical protein ACRDHE_12155, partial [Ktedonobacterales bacterium]
MGQRSRTTGGSKPGTTRQERRAAGRRRGQIARRLRVLRTAGIAVFMLATIAAFVVALAAHGNNAPRNPAAASPDWVSLTSTAPADVRAAARSTRTYQTALAAPQSALGSELRKGTLGTPALV